MQHLGYYDRPLATGIYLTWVTLAFLFFIFNLFLFQKAKVGAKYLKISALGSVLVLIFAYPFLSSDLFNYLFDAKIIIKYNASPYTHRPLDFPQDEWLRFMRWVHRYSPYGPLWLGISIFPAALGLGKFVLNFLAFKIFIASFHLINAVIIYKILKKIDPPKTLIGTAFYAINPLFLIEGVVNAHNDVVFATTLLLAMLFLVTRKKLAALIAVLSGILIKYISLLIFPWVVLNLIEKIDIKKSILLSLITMAIFTFIYSSFKVTVPFVSAGATQVQFQSWYLFWTIPFVALMPTASLIVVALASAFAATLRYLPFLFYGDWSHPGTTGFMQIIFIIPPAITIVLLSVKRLLNR